jgi:hypothetical protein
MIGTRWCILGHRYLLLGHRMLDHRLLVVERWWVLVV